MRLLWVLLLLGACVEDPIPPTKVSCETARSPTCKELSELPTVAVPENFQIAADLLWNYWELEGDPIPLVMIPDTVIQIAGACTVEGSICTSKGLHGRVYLAMSSNLPSETSLAHEYLHVMLLRQNGDSDHTHSGPEWGTFLDSGNKYLHNQGL